MGNFQENMTVWDKIYQGYKNRGEDYATLKKGLIPEFLEFINNTEFKLKKVLDIGCGNGKYLVFLKTLGFEVSEIDSSPTAVEMTKESLNAPGVDRILMVSNDWDSISDIYAFPKDGNGKDLMMDSPSEVYPKQLEKLSISIIKEEKK